MPEYRGSSSKCGDILINVSSKALSHCGIVVKNRDVVHATGRGMMIDDVDMWTTHSDVFRPRALLPALADGIDQVARRLQAQKTQYGKARAGLKSWTGSSSFGSGARERLAKYRTRMAVPFEDSAEAIVKNVFCSEFVVLCYQLASADENGRHFIKLDAKHTLPKNLRAYLQNDLAYWEHIGQLAAG
ncbi:MAG: hypothetical protein KF764_15985 [Labilithrix sp.]|nr:hypothetical protein [Labilithrix sp.]MBX3221760.1 hypothetical protein [Labilithrix sp.]